MNNNNNNIVKTITEDDESDEDDLPLPSNGRKEVNKQKQTTGFSNMVKRIQLAARMSKGSQNEDCYNEDEKLNIYLKSKSSNRRQSNRSSLLPTAFNFKDLIKKIGESNLKSFNHGEIRFQQKDRQYDKKPFVVIQPTITSKELAYIFMDQWELEIPKIITFIISGKSQRSRWKNEKQIKNFQTGITKASMSTNMWIITEGVNSGATSYTCSAIDKEFKKAKLKGLYKLENSFQLFAVVHENHLVYSDKLCNVENLNSPNIVNIENSGFNDGHKFELNPDHSHYIVLKNYAHRNDFILNLIDLFTKKEFNVFCNQDDAKATETPLVSILVEGEPENANLILNLIKKQVPVVVLQGSGGMADIIAYAYTRIMDSFADSSTWDPDYIEEYIKPLLTKKISLQFVELANNLMVRNMVREQVIECIRMSIQDGREYLMLLDMHNINTCNLTNLQEYLLNALLKSRRNVDFSSHDQFLKDFDLIVDWNCANVAKDLLFALNPVNITELLKSKFLNVLIRQNREEFVEIFLSNGFQLHKFLTPSKLSKLFRIIHEDEFFHTVCWETTLSKSTNARQSKFFIENDLNWLLELCTGLQNFVNSEELHLNAHGMYVTELYSAERKALALICMWAVVQNRYELTEVLWKYSDHPVHLALIISMFFERLSWYVFDTNLRAELQQKSEKFANYANGVLDRCYNENMTLAYNVLRESIKEWNYMTAVDIAANARLKQFLAHPCCQKWLTNTFQGKIRIREITWGFWTVPMSVKIILCSLLVFPMYIWVRFNNDDCDSEQKQNDPDEECDDVYDDMYTNVEVKNISQDTPITFVKTSETGNQIKLGFTNKAFDENRSRSFKPKKFISTRNYGEVFVDKQPPLWKMIHMMWCSPISKFYTSELFYIIFLILISLSALYPNCGCFMLDMVVCTWSLLIAISYIRHLYILFLKYSSISIYPKIMEILLILIFTMVYTTTRVFRLYYYPIYWQKIIISLALLYFYYRLFAVYLPISAQLGPFLYRFKMMITVDFVNYMRITIVILIANTIAIRALQYPYQELTIDSIRSVLHQGILSLFNGPPSGKIHVTTDMNKQNEYCGLNPNEQNRIDYNRTIIEEEPLIIYVFVFQYFIILKLILGPLLFSIFSVTASKWVTEIDSIWKFQRYHLVIDFANRLSIPEPFSLFYYVYVIFYYVIGLCTNWTVLQKKPRKVLNQNIISRDDCMYWKQLAAEYLDNERKLEEESQIIYKEWDCVKDITEEIEYEKKVLREIKSKIFELEKFIQTKTNNNAGKNEINVFNKQTRKSSIFETNPMDIGLVGFETHLSRLSPYPGTNINRYPLPRKYISWRIAFLSYEPVLYTKYQQEFPEHLRPFVDEDILKLKRESINNKEMLNKLPTYKWNTQQMDNQIGILIDRQSWQHIDHSSEHASKQPNHYLLEDNFLPLNPSGRTGIRGKGELLRWGPNHYCILIIAQQINNTDSKQIQILFESNKTNEFKLIEKYVNNKDEMYDFITKFFNIEEKIQEEDQLNKAIGKHFRNLPFKFRLIQSGYLDDPSNTDNAWKEANCYLLTVETVLNKKLFNTEINQKLIWCDPNVELCLANLPLVDAHLVNHVCLNYFNPILNQDIIK